MNSKVILNAHPRITLGLKTFGLNEQTKKLVFDGLFLLVDDLHDELHIQPADKFSVKYYDDKNNLLEIPDDLITRSAAFLERFFSVSIKAAVVVKKNVPRGSGLASMAACAAAFIKFYADTYHLSLSFWNIACQINENIPFFLTGFKLGRVQNIGDQISGLTNIKLPKTKIHFTNILVDKNTIYQNLSNNVTNNNVTKLPNNYVSVLIDDLTNNRPFSIGNELHDLIFANSPELMLYYAQLKTRFNQVAVSGFGSSIIEIEDPFFSVAK